MPEIRHLFKFALYSANLNRWRISVDASGEGGLGGHLRIVGASTQTSWSVRLAGTQEGDEWVGLSTILELQAISLALDQADAMVPHRWKRLTIAVDSQAAVSIVKKGYSTRSPEANEVCKVIEDKVWKTKTLLTTFWVPRRFNWRADILSHPPKKHNLGWDEDLPETAAQLMERQDRQARTPHSTHSSLSLHSTERTSMASTRKEVRQHDSLDQSEGPRQLNAKRLLVSGQAVRRKKSLTVATEGREPGALRLRHGEPGRLESTRDGQIHHTNPGGNGMAGNPDTKPTQGHEDVLDQESPRKTQTLKRNAAQKANIYQQDASSSTIDAKFASRGRRQDSSRSSSYGVLRDSASERGATPYAQGLVMESEQGKAAHNQRQDLGQDTRLTQSYSGDPGQRGLETPSASLDQPTGGMQESPSARQTVTAKVSRTQDNQVLHETVSERPG